MNRQELIKKTRLLLAKSGFYISNITDSRSICFDIVARRDNSLVIIKVLTNVDSFSKQNSYELIVLSDMLHGTPLVIGEHTNQKKIERGVVYYRYGVPLISSETLSDSLLEGIAPLVFSAPGGFYVNINGEVLQKAREAKKISLGALATIAGVSRKAIQMYEEGMSTVIEVAIRLEEFLDIPLIRPIDPFKIEYSTSDKKIKIDKFSDNEHKIFSQLQVLGYNVVPITHCPFDALTKDNKEDVIKEFGRNTQDTGSAEVQIALLTRRIEDLTGHFKANP